jgi:hypothetical protein
MPLRPFLKVSYRCSVCSPFAFSFRFRSLMNNWIVEKRNGHFWFIIIPVHICCSSPGLMCGPGSTKILRCLADEIASILQSLITLPTPALIPLHIVYRLLQSLVMVISYRWSNEVVFNNYFWGCMYCIFEPLPPPIDCNPSKYWLSLSWTEETLDSNPGTAALQGLLSKIVHEASTR